MICWIICCWILTVYVTGRFPRVTRQRLYGLINIHKLSLCHSRIHKFPLWTCRETVALQSSTVPTIPPYLRVQKWKVDRFQSSAVSGKQRQFCRAFKSRITISLWGTVVTGELYALVKNCHRQNALFCQYYTKVVLLFPFFSSPLNPAEIR